MTSIQRRHTMVITPQWTYLPGNVIETPDGALDSLGALLDRVVQQIPSGETVTLLVGHDAARTVGLPTATTQFPDRDRDAQAPETAHEAAIRAAGWRLGIKDTARLGTWTTLTRDKHATIHLAMLDLIDHSDAKTSPLTGMCRVTTDLITATGYWRKAAGAPWYGQAQNAGVASIRATVRYGRQHKEPTWRGEAPPDTDAREADYLEDHWIRPADQMRGTPYLHGWDTVQMHLAAARNTPLPAKVPTRDNTPIDWADGLAGWWRIDLEDWGQDDQIPSPAGYLRDRKSRYQAMTRWVTGPTMQLLQQLRDQGTHPGYKVLDSVTAERSTTLLRTWGDNLNGAYKQHAAAGGAADLAVCKAIKASYQRGISHMANPRALVYRPDWTYAIIAMARANLWRRMWTLGREHDWWPAKIHTDCIYYPSADPEPVPPPGIRTDNDRIGQLGAMAYQETQYVGALDT